ncbi:hypothetical protein BJ878DRAFT_63491 [Calycina marina]|uniref:Expansin-like EG45 domain-containing protein n=1 Tax=Calycina marina TaxID=1763456 RepID=A0A9P8CGL0_9HELO|nr:hypothetical protein BJ878DRAFT_63491 [Calycina marina]
MLSSYVFAAAFLKLASAASLSGEATFYDGNLNGGACSFTTLPTLPAGVYGTATANWDNSADCGACVSVTGPSGNSITAMIVDECPGCGTNHLDLFSDAFAALANPTTGIIDVTWEYVNCPITAPLQLHNKDGVSAYWFSMQVVDANQAIESLEVSEDGGSTWQPTTRMAYNFFEQSSGFGASVDVKVTSVNGDVVIVNDVSVTSGSSVTASSNFATTGSAAVVASSIASPATSSVVPVMSSVVAPVEVAAPSPTPITSNIPALAPLSTTTAPEDNFVELSTFSPTTLSTIVAAVAYMPSPIAAPAPVFTEVTQSASSIEASYTASAPTYIPAPIFSSSAETNTTAAQSTYYSSVGTTSVYTPLASGSTPSPSSTSTSSYLPVSGASRTVAGLGSLVTLCMGILAVF